MKRTTVRSDVLDAFRNAAIPAPDPKTLEEERLESAESESEQG